MKVCTKCKKEKNLSDFGKFKHSKDGLKSVCKICNNQNSKEYYYANKENIATKNKQYREDNKEFLKSYSRSYYNDNKERRSNYYKEWYLKNKDSVKKYKNANEKAIIAYNKKYKSENKDKINAYNRKYRKDRRDKDPIFKLKCNLSKRTSEAFSNKGYSKNSNTCKILGGDYEIVSKHIEKKFTEGMSWENYGEWQIDHIIPLASASTQSELLYLCHYKNLQPLWATENLQKKDKVIDTQLYLPL